MVVLIRESVSGSKTRVCGARCYQAKGDKCSCCCCSGTNHGIGLREATQNTQRHAETLVQQGKQLGVYVDQAIMDLP